MAYFRQSKRRTAMFLHDLLNQPCCPSLTVKMQNQEADALAVPYEELKQALADQDQVHMDESPTKEANRKAWLWTAVTKLFAVFAIFPSRAGTAVPQLLGESYAGIVNCDRAKMYWQAKRLQWCWAHWKRDFQALIDHSHRAWLWTFVEHEGIEPTNNAAERALRHAVIWRKLSFGTQSERGIRFVERLLTTIETCRLQQRNVFEYLTAAVEAHLAKQQPPSLLPTL